MRITPAHNAVLGYAEWCCDNQKPWPKLAVVAADVARNLTEMERAMRDLQRWGLITIEAKRPHARVRLGDGRETP